MGQTRIVGIDIGGTKTAVVVGDESGAVSWRTQFATDPARGFPPVFADLCRALDEAVAPAAPAALSVAVGGPLDPVRGIILSPPNLPGWDGIPLKEALQVRYGRPVYIERDANAGALAEFHFGAGRGCRSLVFLTLGTGCGAGLISDGRLLRGVSFGAGEIGHIRVAEDGPSAYGKAGSLEGFASGSGLVKLARWMDSDARDEAPTVPELYQAWREGDPRAKAVFERAALGLGRGLAVLVDLFNPERIILGGLGLRIQDALIEPAKAVMRREALPISAAACEVIPAGLGDRLGDVAALCAALDQGGWLRQRETS